MWSGFVIPLKKPFRFLIEQQSTQPLQCVPAVGNIKAGCFEPRLFVTDTVNRLPAAASIQTRVMRVKKRKTRGLVQPAIGHHLIHIRLANPALGIVHARRDPLPLRVDDLNHPITLADEDVGLCLEQLLPCLHVPKAV